MNEITNKLYIILAFDERNRTILRLANINKFEIIEFYDLEAEGLAIKFNQNLKAGEEFNKDTIQKLFEDNANIDFICLYSIEISQLDKKLKYHISLDNQFRNGKTSEIFTLNYHKDYTESVSKEELSFLAGILKTVKKITSEIRAIDKKSSGGNSNVNFENSPLSRGISFLIELFRIEVNLNIERALADFSNNKAILESVKQTNFKKPESFTMITSKIHREIFQQEGDNLYYSERFESNKYLKIDSYSTALDKNKNEITYKNTAYMKTKSRLSHFDLAILNSLLTLAEAQDIDNPAFSYNQIINLAHNPLAGKRIRTRKGSKNNIIEDVKNSIIRIGTTWVDWDFKGDKAQFSGNEELQKVIANIKSESVLLSVELKEVVLKNGKTFGGVIIDKNHSSYRNLTGYIKSLKRMKTISTDYLKNPLTAHKSNTAIYNLLKYKVSNMPYYENKGNKNLLNQKIKLIKKAKNIQKKNEKELKKYQLKMESDKKERSIFDKADTEHLKELAELNTDLNSILVGLPEYQATLDFQNSLSENLFKINIKRFIKELNIPELRKERVIESIEKILEEWKKELIIKDYEFVSNIHNEHKIQSVQIVFF